TPSRPRIRNHHDLLVRLCQRPADISGVVTAPVDRQHDLIGMPELPEHLKIARNDGADVCGLIVDGENDRDQARRTRGHDNARTADATRPSVDSPCWAAMYAS